MTYVNNYKLISVLGEGLQGQVYLAERRDDKKLYALKFIDRFYKDHKLEEQVIQQLEQEINAIGMIDSDRVVKSTECFTIEEFYVLVMEYCRNGDLCNYVKKKGCLQEPEAVDFLAQILDGMRAVHKENLIHRDIKPENLLLDEAFSIKICDLGASITYDKDNLHESLSGTFHYMAPEMENFLQYDFSVDIWSVGCCLFFMLLGKSPFSFCQSSLAISNSVQELCIPRLDFKKLLSKHEHTNSLPESSALNISNEAQDLISRMMTYSPQERISLLDIIKHPLLKKYEHSCQSVRYLSQQLVGDISQRDPQSIQSLSDVPLGEHLPKIQTEIMQSNQSQTIPKDGSIFLIPSLRIITMKDIKQKQYHTLKIDRNVQSMNSFINQQALKSEDLQKFTQAPPKKAFFQHLQDALSNNIKIFEVDSSKSVGKISEKENQETANAISYALPLNSEEFVNDQESVSNKIQLYSTSSNPFELKNKLAQYPNSPRFPRHQYEKSSLNLSQKLQQSDTPQKYSKANNVMMSQIS